jgi:hypothetical protein
MSTFLELAVDLAEEVDLASNPASVESQAGEFKKLVKWLTKSYMEIQNRAGGRWRWLRREFTVNTTSGDDSYAPGDCTDVDAATTIDRFSEWRLIDPRDPPKIYLTSTGVGGEYWLIYIPWDDFKRIYKIGSQATNTGSPAHITFDPQNNIVLGPAPNDIYTVTGDFYRSPQVLALDADVPEMPSHYHNLIVYRAMEKYGRFNAAPEVELRGRVEGRALLRQLENNQMPKMRTAAPLA